MSTPYGTFGRTKLPRNARPLVGWNTSFTDQSVRTKSGDEPQGLSDNSEDSMAMLMLKSVPPRARLAWHTRTSNDRLSQPTKRSDHAQAASSSVRPLHWSSHWMPAVTDPPSVTTFTAWDARSLARNRCQLAVFPGDEARVAFRSASERVIGRHFDGDDLFMCTVSNPSEALGGRALAVFQARSARVRRSLSDAPAPSPAGDVWGSSPCA